MTRKFFEPAMVPLSIKEELCESLLEEFGAISIRNKPTRQELTHGCLVGSHSDQLRNPTASLNYEKLTYKCLGCKAQGGILWLITKVRSCTWEEARAWLEQATGTGKTLMPLSRLLEFYDALYADKKTLPPIPVFAESVLDPWTDGGVHPYFAERHIPEDTALRFRLGYDRSQDRIVIPHFWKGQLVGWQTREPRKTTGDMAKYLSTDEFPREQTIFNYDPKRRSAVVFEAPMSVLRHAHRLPVEATFGASITDRQIKVLGAHCEKLILWLDNDEAGWKALEGSKDNPGVIQRASKYGAVWVVDSPFSGDPGEVDTDTAEALIDSAVPASVWRRPASLACPRCFMAFHEGGCVRGEDDGDS